MLNFSTTGMTNEMSLLRSLIMAGARVLQICRCDAAKLQSLVSKVLSLESQELCGRAVGLGRATSVVIGDLKFEHSRFERGDGEISNA